MHLYFLRHGEADWPNWEKSDDERPLTERGRKEMQKVADFLKLLDVSLDQIVTSPLPRAQQTAQIVADRLKLKLREERALAPGFAISDLKLLRSQYPGKNIMLVGHEPDFSETISALTGASLKLSKAGLALVEADESATSGKLLWLFPPKIARKGAG
jgi:phosphohistidine phosphatase